MDKQVDGTVVSDEHKNNIIRTRVNLFAQMNGKAEPFSVTKDHSDDVWLMHMAQDRPFVSRRTKHLFFCDTCACKGMRTSMAVTMTLTRAPPTWSVTDASDIEVPVGGGWFVCSCCSGIDICSKCATDGAHCPSCDGVGLVDCNDTLEARVKELLVHP